MSAWRVVPALALAWFAAAFLVWPRAQADGPASPPDTIFGVWDASAQPGPPANAAWGHLTGLGVRFVRMPFEWRAIETTPGNYDWSAYDAKLIALKQAGLTPLLIVSNAPFPRTYTPGAAICGPLTGQGLQAFEQFLRAAMERYGSRASDPTRRNAVRYWQIYNEADFYIKDLTAPDGAPGALGGGCLGNTVDPYNPTSGETNWGPRQYVEILRRAWNAKQAADPEAKIVFAALASDGDLSTTGCYDPTDLDLQGRPRPGTNPATTPFNCQFFPRVLAAGGAEVFDLVAFNSYLYYRWNHETPQAKGFLGKIDRFRQYLREAALAQGRPATAFDKPIAVVETGLAYGAGTAPCALPNNTACRDFTPDDPALLVAPILGQSLQARAVFSTTPLAITIWFALTTDRPDPAGDWGLVYRGEQTQAYRAFQYFLAQMTGMRFLSDLGEPTMLGSGRPLGGSEPCLNRPDHRCNTLQWLVFDRPDGLQRHLLWIDSGYPREPHAWRYRFEGGQFIAEPLVREVGFPVIAGQAISVTTDLGVPLTPVREEAGYRYYTVTHRAIYATLSPLLVTAGADGVSLRYLPPPQTPPTGPPPGPPLTLTFPSGSVPPGSQLFFNPLPTPSQGLGAFSLNCYDSAFNPCQPVGVVQLVLTLPTSSLQMTVTVYRVPDANSFSSLSRLAAAPGWEKVGTLSCQGTRCSGSISAGTGRFVLVDETPRTYVPISLTRAPQ
ncbi:MAG: hypothetical protein KatS3mg061_0935 [Dehalococcoidia bacterium]|nr:MAG: hypothetical protein KatS3mg061_0935 [Dehalococcoidia bacterium]